VPTALVVLALAGVAFWGHHTDWSFAVRHRAVKEQGHGRGELAQVRSEPAGKDSAEALPGLGRRVRIEFESADAVERAGIDIAPAWQAAMTEAVTAGGEIRFDPDRVARLSARAPGSAWRVARTVGDPVKAGDLLALIDAAEVGRAKAELQQALVQARLKQTALTNIAAAGTAIPERQRREAQAAAREAEVRLHSAEQALANLGLPVRADDYQALSLQEVVRRMRLLGLQQSEAAGLGPTVTTANLLPVRAPFEGVVLRADVVAGEVVEPGKVLFVVVDPSRLWLTLHVGPQDARRVAIGQTVKFRPDGQSDEFEGRLNWIGTAADETTRTVPVRAELANGAGLLRASTLGQGRIVLRTEPNAVVVPHEAVQSFRGSPVVFVRDPTFLEPGGTKAFHARPVRTGARDAQNMEILAGLRPGETVATKGSGLLLNELLRAGR
jgi:cobalt-zinc-cadmium efflux system membrane fusion protein